MSKDEGVAKDSFSFYEIYSFENDGITNMIFSLNNKDLNIENYSYLD